MHLPGLDGDNYGTTEASRNACTLGREMEDGSAPLPAKVDQKLTSLGEAEADLREVSNGPPAHVHVAQWSTEEREHPRKYGEAGLLPAWCSGWTEHPPPKETSLLHTQCPLVGSPHLFFFFLIEHNRVLSVPLYGECCMCY